MAVSAARVTAGTTAVALNTASSSGQRLTVRNTDATNGADLGAVGVTAGAGFLLAANTQVTVELPPGDVLYAIRSAGADVVLAVLRS